MPETTKNQRSLDYAFDYFDLHAKQRMTVFNFFLVIAGILTGGVAASLGKESMPLLALALSIVLVLISVVFWKLDARTSFLIKHAEAALMECETELLNENARLISTEEEASKSFRRQNRFWRTGWSYSVCLRIVFIAMIIIGSIGLALSTVRLSQSSKSPVKETLLQECVWRVKVVPASTTNVEQLSQCSGRRLVLPNTNTSVGP